MEGSGGSVGKQARDREPCLAPLDFGLHPLAYPSLVRIESKGGSTLWRANITVASR